MKNIIIILFLGILPLSGYTKIKHRKYKDVLVQINELEESNKIDHAILVAITNANKIVAKNGFSEVVRATNNFLQEYKKEVVTQTDSDGFSFSFLFGLFSGNFGRSIDMTTFVTTNQKDVSRFPNKVEKSYRKLKKKLLKFVSKKETELFYAKVLTAKAYDLITKLDIEEIRSYKVMLDQTFLKVTTVEFLGKQSITKCTQTRYANKESNLNASLSSFILSFDFESNKNQHAYTDNNCESEEFNLRVDESMIFSSDLAIADNAIKMARKKLEFKILIEAQAPDYPNWGSPYLN